MMKKPTAVFRVAAFLVLTNLATARADEDFKGQPNPQQFTVGAAAGLGIVDGNGGFALIGSAAKKIIDRGFAPDINNQVFVELELGTAVRSGPDSFVYGAHLRWDFEKDAEWTFFAIGGLGGNVTDQAGTIGEHWELFPRFGAGAFWRPAWLPPNLSVRGELSHELTVVGVSLAL
jgi:hypothetical protein